MKRPGLRTALLLVGLLLVLLAAGSPWIVAGYWRIRSSNPVRRGVARAQELGCFTCHGNLGRTGIPEPGSDENVPRWDGSVWMMYVKNDEDIRRYILEGSHHEEGAAGEGERDAIAMPAYEHVIDRGDLEDLVAAFKVLSGMVAPPRGTPARSGYDLARERKCFSCHGPGGSGGLTNPGSWTGFIPGWYGAEFDDLVRNPEEFDSWVRDGSIARLANHPIARYFIDRQRISMPGYRDLTAGQLDDLRAYVRWLKETDGGHDGEILSW
jgi:mono/diheme cytochrome c family protein